MKLALSAALILMAGYDFYSTYAILSKGGEEKNAVLLWLKAHTPGEWTWLVIAKSWMLAAVAAGWYWKAWDGDGIYALWALACFYAWICIHNYHELKK